jgi:alpha-1,3/alpha-1,6-mannosyltransferase
MSFADAIAVNSGFTKGIVTEQWPGLAQEKQLEIVHPCVDVSEKKELITGEENALTWQDTNIILSINRFEEKKNIGLAIRAFSGLPKHARSGVRLVVAGGYDHRVAENVTYHHDLVSLAEGLGLKTATTTNIVTALNVPDDVDVLFLLSVPASFKDALLKSARLLVYTPSNEHFGIVPLEAMLVGTPVLAANTGGPLETVVEGETGWLRDPEDVERWTEVMDKVLHKMTPGELEKMAEAGKRRVKSEFSEDKMAEVLERMIERISGTPKQFGQGMAVLSVFFALAPVILLGLCVSIWRVYRR